MMIMPGTIVYAVLWWFVTVCTTGGHFHWQELVVQDEVSNGQKVAFYESVGVIPVARGNALKNRRLRSQFVADMVAYCPTQPFDFFPIPRFLQVNRIYFATDVEDMVIWKRFHGELPWFTIVSLANEIKVLELLVERTQEFDEHPPDDMDNLPWGFQRDCLDQYKFFARWALAYVRRIREEDIGCGTFRHVHEFPGLWQAAQLEASRNPPLYHLAMQWLLSYAEREIRPYLLHPQHCPEDHTYHHYDHLTILALQPSHWIHHNQSSTTWLAVSERRLPSLLSESHEQCHRQVRALRTARDGRWPPPGDDAANGEDKNRPCSQRVRELSPLVDDGNSTDYRAALIALNGGGSFTTATVWCIHDRESGTGTTVASPTREEEDEGDCYVSPNNMHAYMEMFFALVVPFYYYQPRRPGPSQTQPQPHVISVGLGGGTTPNFMAMYYPNWLVTSVEIDQTGVQFYEKFFGGDRVLCEKASLRMVPSATSHDSDNSNTSHPQWTLQRDETATGTGVSSSSPRCRSRVVVADAIAYFQYLADSLPPNSNNSNHTNTSTSTTTAQDTSIDVIFLDVFDSHAVTWSGDVYEGISNMPLRSMITPILPVLHRLVRATSGLVAFHLHKDSQVPPFVVDDVVPLFGEANVVVFESGADLYVVASSSPPPPLSIANATVAASDSGSGSSSGGAGATTCGIEDKPETPRCPREQHDHAPFVCAATAMDRWVDYVRTFRPPAVAPEPGPGPGPGQATHERTEALRSLYPHHMHAAHQYDLDCTAIARWRRMVQGLSPAAADDDDVRNGDGHWTDDATTATVEEDHGEDGEAAYEDDLVISIDVSPTPPRP